MLRATVPLALLALVAACSSGGGSEASPSPSSSTPSSTPGSDPYVSLAPPRSPGIGDFDAAVSNRAYLAAQGLLAEALLERGTLQGADPKQLATDLAGVSQDVTVLRALGTPPQAAGLSFRPLLGPGVTLPAGGFATVERSSWGGVPVVGRGGESAIRITWDGAIRYRVTYQGTQRDVAYALKTGWVFSPDPRIPSGLELVTTLKGTVHIAPQPPACSAKGVMVPVGVEPTEADFSGGPYVPGRYPAGFSCPS